MPVPPLSTRERFEVERLRTILKGYQLLLSHYHRTGQIEVIDNDGFTWNVLDLKHFVEHLDDYFAPRQAEAIRLLLIEDLTEEDACQVMGLPRDQPVYTYVNQALRQFAPLTRLRTSRHPRGYWAKPSRLGSRLLAAA